MFETWNFSNMSWELLIWNFQMRLEKEVLFETFWNLKLFKPIMGGLLIWNFQMRLENDMCYLKLFNLFKPIMRAAYLKLSDESWNKICYLKCLKLETFRTCHGGLLIWNFQMRLEMRCAIWNFSNFSTHHRSWLFETFRWDLKMRGAIWNFSTFSNQSWELLIWNFQMSLETRYAIWNVWNFLTLETFKTFQTHHVGLLIWNFQMRFEMRCAIWNFWNLKLCSWNYLKCLMCPLRTKKFQLTLNLAIIHFDVVSSDVWFLLTALILLNIVSIKVCFYQSLI